MLMKRNIFALLFTFCLVCLSIGEVEAQQSPFSIEQQEALLTQFQNIYKNEL